MKKKLKTSLAARIFNVIYKEHRKGVYIYTLGEALVRDNKILFEISASGKSEIKEIEKYFGEALADMLYEISDAAIMGLELSSDLKHDIFLEHLESNLLQAQGLKSEGAQVSHARKA
jgi:hypothetical protein